MNGLRHRLAGLLLGIFLLAPVTGRAADLTDSCWSETAASNICASPSGWPDNLPPSSVKAIGRETMGALKRDWNRSHSVVSSTGSANAYVVTYAAAPAAYANGEQYSFIANFANTGSATTNVNGLGAKTIQKATSSGLANLASGDIQVGQHVHLEYDSAAGVLVLLNPQATSLGANSVSNSQLAQMPANTIKGNNTGSTGNPADLTVAQAVTMLGVVKSVMRQTFTSSGTYTPHAGLLYADVELVGGGGGGGGTVSPPASNINVCGSGGAGGYARKVFTAATIGASQTVTIGSAGTAGSTAGTNGGTGGTTTFGSLLQATGGAGGQGLSGGDGGASFHAGGLGGVGSLGDITLMVSQASQAWG
jgi:hypothetical protein